MIYTKDLKEIKSFRNGILNIFEASMFDYVLFYQAKNSLKIKLSNEYDKEAFCLRINKGASSHAIAVPARIINAYRLHQSQIEIRKIDCCTYTIERKRYESIVRHYPGIALKDDSIIPKDSKYITTVMSRGGGICKRFEDWGKMNNLSIVQVLHMNKKHPYIEVCPESLYDGDYSDVSLLTDEYGREFQYFAGEKIAYKLKAQPNGYVKFAARGVFRRKFNLPLEHPYDIYQYGKRFYFVPHWPDDSITKEDYDRREQKTEKAFLCEDCNNQNEHEPTLKEIMEVLNSFKVYVKTADDEKRQLQERLIQSEKERIQSEKEKESLLIHMRKLSSQIFEMEQKLKVDRNIY